MLTEKILTIAAVADQFILWLLLVMSLLSFTFIIERYFVLIRVSHHSKRVQKKIENILQNNHLEELQELVHDPFAIESKLLSYALPMAKKGASVNEIFASLMIIERQKLERYLIFLATIGSTAPFIGLLGTVLGIMKAFNDLAISVEANQQTVMAGIAFALVATATGLFVAIPAVMFYNYYQRKVKLIMQNIECLKELTIAVINKINK